MLPRRSLNLVPGLFFASFIRMVNIRVSSIIAFRCRLTNAMHSLFVHRAVLDFRKVCVPFSNRQRTGGSVIFCNDNNVSVYILV